MNIVKRTIDLNAHVENLSCTVTIENAKPYGTISFTNLGYGVLSAIKLIAKGFNLFGDQVSINGKNEFYVVLQDLCVPINTKVTDIKINLPDTSIRKVVIRESQLIFSDGRLVSYTAPNPKEYIIEELTETDDHEKDILDVLRDYESTSVCLPQKNAEGWICVCGQFNGNEDETCSRCAKAFLDTAVFLNPDEIERKIQIKREDKIKENEMAAKNALREQRKKRTRNFGIVVGLVVGLIVVVRVIALIINAHILSSRITYNSLNAMINDLEGTWVYKSSYGGSVLRIIKIDEKTLTKTYPSIEHSIDFDITYHPSRGYFEVLGSKYIVSKIDHQTVIRNNDDIYERSYSYIPATTNTAETTSDTFDTYLKENGVTLDNSDVQYNMTNNVDKMFSLVGYAELDDYYNYGFDDDIESTYFCLFVTPLEGSCSDCWYIYCHRDSFQRLFNKAQNNGRVYVQMVCIIPSYRFEKNQQCMAQLEYVVY